MQTPVCDSDSELWAMSEGGLQCVHLALGASKPTTCPRVRSLQLAWSSALALGGCLIPQGTAGGTWRRGALARTKGEGLVWICDVGLAGWGLRLLYLLSASHLGVQFSRSVVCV